MASFSGRAGVPIAPRRSALLGLLEIGDISLLTVGILLLESDELEPSLRRFHDVDLIPELVASVRLAVKIARVERHDPA